MKLDALKFGYAAGITAGIVWVVCSVLVLSLPSMTMDMGGGMTHMDPSQMAWSMTPSGLLLGLVAWSIVAAAFGWLVAAIYNRLL